LLDLAGVGVSHDPAAIFECIRDEIALYSTVDYEAIGLLGTKPSPAPQEVMG